MFEGILLHNFAETGICSKVFYFTILQRVEDV